MSDLAAVIERLHEEAPLTDIHAHPSLKAYLFRRNLWRHYRSGSRFDPFASRSDFDRLTRGGVRVVWAANYLPERPLFRDCPILGLATALIVPVYRKLMTGRPLDRLLEIMDALEREIARRPDRTALARSVAELDRITGEGKIAFVHTVEGAHALDGDPAALELLARRGVAMLTLAHFYPNGAVGHVDGMPPHLFVRRICRFEFGIDAGTTLTEYGRALLAEMDRLRILPDLTHCTPAARAAVLEELGPDRPVVVSHVGVARHNPDPYNLDDDEIREVARRGGLIGVILMPYWLEREPAGDGLEAIWKTIEHVHKVTGSWRTVAIGTDFDGFTEPPPAIPDAARLGRLTAMLLARDVAEDDVLDILGRNARRVLAAGWR